MNGFNALTETRHGPFLYNRHDQIVGRSLELYGEYCQGEIELLLQLCGPGSVVADIGANIGAVAIPLALHVGPRGTVLAFEPQRVVFQTLCANAALHSLTNIDCIPFAVGASAGTIDVPEIRYDVDANFGGVALGNGGMRITMTTLDAYADRGPFALVKIDVEGMELDVVRGAQRVLAQQRPLLYVENDRPDRSAALIDALRASGYDLYWHRPLLFNPQNYRGNANNIFGDGFCINMLGIPRERAARIEGFDPVD